MNEVKINLNEVVKVKLTDLGKDIYYHQFDEVNQQCGKIVCKPSFPEEDAEGYTKFQLWVFIDIYGKYFGITEPNVIEPLEIVYELPYELPKEKNVIYADLISNLQEEAEWAEANEWETPIMLSDHLKQAINAIEAQDRHILTLQQEMMAEAESHIAEVNRLNKQIKELQANMRPVVKGQWENTRSDVWKCSACGYGIMPWNAGVNFCPNCGADMRESPKKE